MKIPQSRSGATPKSSHGILNGWLALAACLAVFPLSNASAIVDLDSDTLDDVWEERFNAQSALPGDDDDGDGKTNLEECLAGTDPFDPASCLGLASAALTGSTASLSFPTVDGKCYQVQIGNTTTGTGGFADVGPVYNGTGGNLTIALSNSSATETSGSATAQLWMGIGSGALSSLTGDPNYPNSPTAVHALDSLQIQSNVDDNYGGRVLGFIKPPDTGNYTFYISGRNQSEFWLSTDDNPGNISRACWSFDASITEGDFTKFGTQTSASIALTAGQKYYFEIRHKHAGQEDFCAVAWDRPTTPPATIEIVDGAFLCPFLTAPDTDPVPELDGNSRKFIRVVAKDLDQDGDGVSDWAEKQMQGEGNFHFADPDSTTAPGTPNDLVAVTNALGAGGETITVSVADAAAIEDPRNSNQMNAGTLLANTARNPARFRLNRSGSLQPVTVSYSLGGVALPDESAESGDYAETDVNGAPLSGTANIPFGHVSCQIVLDPVRDGVHEYPEFVRCTVNPGAGYTVGATATGDIEISDAQDIPEQEILFVGRSNDEPGSVLPKGTGIVSGFVNGRKNFMRLNSLIMAGFSSPQNDSHIHKANAGPLPGGIVYEITEVPGDPGSDPKVGELLNYPWNIVLAGGFTAQRIVDSLFNQNSETPMYLNWHTNNNQSGELWAILAEETGSIDPPDPPAAPPAITPLAGADLEREVRRFLNQATFGATDKDVYDMLNTWIPAAGGNRILAYNNWIDDQIDNIPQTWLVDYTLAADNQEWTLRGYYDASRWFVNQFDNPGQPLVNVPDRPANFPAIDRTTYAGTGLLGSAVNTMVHFPSNQWVPTQNYPLTQAEINWGKNEDRYVPFDLAEVNHNNRRRGHWLLMLNARDQLRQKTGYALQQILVVSEKLTRVRQNHIAAANYQDQLNYYAFEHFRDQFSWVNWSPIMGKWLSSLKNQQAFDTSIPADGIPDVFPDENLAREDMQLFSIGLLTLWRDGTLKLSAQTGLPEPTYNNDDITEFARVLTGQSFSRTASDPGDWGIVTGVDQGDPFDTNNNNAGGADNDGLLWNNTFDLSEGNMYYGHQFNYPMRMFGANHDPGVKVLAGGKVIDNTGTGNLDRRGRDDIEDAVTWFAGQPGSDSFDMVTAHQSTPAFIAERLIQRLTKSNPSSAYLYRVANAFAADGGNLRDAVKAILLDYEVRELALADSDTTTGLKQPPLDAFMRLFRNFSQRDTTGGGVFTEAAFTQYPIADPALAGVNPIPTNAEFPVTAPPADGYLNTFGYPAAQAANFTMNCVFLAPLTDNTLTMSPFAQDTVFNFYLPGYSPGGPVGDASLVSPELQLATETTVIQNVNYFRALDVGVNGVGFNDLGGNPGQNAAGTENKPANYNARLLYGIDGDGNGLLPDGSDVDNYDNIRIALVEWGDNIIPWAAPGTGVNTQAAFDDIVALVDAIDLRLMDGRFQAKYPLDPGLRLNTDAANEDPGVDGINKTKATTDDTDFTNDRELRNPRELLVRGLYDMSYNPYSTNPASAQSNKRALLQNALELMTGTPEFLVHK